MKKFPKVFAIILNYNGGDLFLDCLKSVFYSDYPNLEVVIVDNDSSDDSFEKAREQFSRAHFIKNSANTGFSKGNNLGIRFALEKFADFVFILNNDAIIEKSTISSLIRAYNEKPSSGIVSPLIMDPISGNVWFAGGLIDWTRMKAYHRHDVGATISSYLTEYVSGCAMLINKDVFKKIGLFDERYFLYYEDVDFSLRAKKAGYLPIISPLAKIKHFENSNNSDEKTYWLVLSALIFFQTHASFFRKIWLFFYMIGRKIKNFFDIATNKNSLAKDVRRAYVDFSKML